VIANARQSVPQPADPADRVESHAASDAGGDRSAVAMVQSTASFVIDTVAAGGGIDQIVVTDQSAATVFGARDQSGQAAPFADSLGPSATPIVLVMADQEPPHRGAPDGSQSGPAGDSPVGANGQDAGAQLDSVFGTGTAGDEIWGSNLNDGMTVHSLTGPIHDVSGGVDASLSPATLAAPRPCPKSFPPSTNIPPITEAHRAGPEAGRPVVHLAGVALGWT